MDRMMKTQARHILMRYLVNGRATGYGVDFKTSERVAVAQLRKEGYIEIYGTIDNYVPGISDVTRTFVQVIPTEKLIALQESLLIIDVKNPFAFLS